MCAKRIRIIFIILCICLGCGSFTAMASGNNTITETMTDDTAFPEVDRVMREFIETHLGEEKYQLSDDLNVDVTYAQMVGDLAVSAVMGELVSDYGFKAKTYLFYVPQNDSWHMFIDIYLGRDALVTEKDMILIQSTALRSDLTKSSASLLTKDFWGNWKHQSDIPLKNAQSTTKYDLATDMDTPDYLNKLSTKPYLSGEDLKNTGKDRRILIHETGPSYFTLYDAFSSSVMISNTVNITWKQDVESLKAMTAKDSFSIKPILGILLILLDATVVVLVVRYVRANHRKTTENQQNQDFAENENIETEQISEKDTLSKTALELKEILDLTNEDIDYLKSIGYFSAKRPNE